jgi:replication-associated recombination protein RarA
MQQVMDMIPPTKNGLPAMECVSAMQKAIRRGMEREAMEFAVELLHTSKGFLTMVTNRLEIISHEDIDTISQPWIVPFVATATAQAQRFYKDEKMGMVRMTIGNAIRMMARAKKSREGDHFAIAVGQRSLLEGFVPEVPEWAQDQHTMKGKAMGRGLEHFRTEGTKLVPPADPDQYEDEAFRLLAIKQQRGIK